MEADEAPIRSIPWCAALISGPNIVSLPTASRAPKTSTGDALFVQTPKTPDTISGCLTFYEQPGGLSALASAPINKIKTLLSLGSGLNGYPHAAQGGLVATLVDETMGLLLSVNKHSKGVSPDIEYHLPETCCHAVDDTGDCSDSGNCGTEDFCSGERG